MVKFASCLVLFSSMLFSLPGMAQESITDGVGTQSIVMGEPSPQSLKEFRKALLTNAEKAVKAKEISRLDLFRLRVATMNKSTLEKMHQACAEQVLADGQATSYGAIDWSKLLASFKEFLPILLELLKLFADRNPVQLQTGSMVCYSATNYFVAA